MRKSRTGFVSRDKSLSLGSPVNQSRLGGGGEGVLSISGRRREREGGGGRRGRKELRGARGGYSK